jgi:hypothetical protein
LPPCKLLSLQRVYQIVFAVHEAPHEVERDRYKYELKKDKDEPDLIPIVLGVHQPLVVRIENYGLEEGEEVEEKLGPEISIGRT